MQINYSLWKQQELYGNLHNWILLTTPTIVDWTLEGFSIKIKYRRQIYVVVDEMIIITTTAIFVHLVIFFGFSNTCFQQKSNVLDNWGLVSALYD